MNVVDKITIDEFKKYINNNTPFIVKNFLNNYKNDSQNSIKNIPKNTQDIQISGNYKEYCSSELINDFIEETNNTYSCAPHGCYNYTNKKIKCNHPLIEGLMVDKDLQFSDLNRFWEHSKNNFTRNHYDGNGINVINICLKGKKRFYLANPKKTLQMYPLSNISINSNPDDSFYDYIVELNKGDMIYIPSYWWHKVLTLEDNSRNLNFNFYNKNVKIPQRDQTIYKLHKLTKSDFSKDPICKYTNDVLDFSFFSNSIFELIIPIILIIIIAKVIPFAVFVSLFILMVIIMENEYLNIEYYGYTKMIITVLILFLIITTIFNFVLVH